MRRDPWARRLSEAELDAAAEAAASAQDAVRHDPAAVAEIMAWLLADLWFPNNRSANAETVNKRVLEHIIGRVTDLAQEATALAITRAALERAAKR
jgi:hypothetical protein